MALHPEACVVHHMRVILCAVRATARRFVDTVLTDKTGTLTRNELVLAGVLPAAAEALSPPATLAAAGGGAATLLRAWWAMSECGSARPDAAAAADARDPFDRAVLACLAGSGDGAATAPDCGECLVHDAPFESASKLALRVFARTAGGGGGARAVIMGAPDVLVAACGCEASANADLYLTRRARVCLMRVRTGTSRSATGRGCRLATGARGRRLQLRSPASPRAACACSGSRPQVRVWRYAFRCADALSECSRVLQTTCRVETVPWAAGGASVRSRRVPRTSARSRSTIRCAPMPATPLPPARARASAS